MLTEDYVSLEIAKLLKEKGFDERICHYYDDEEFLHRNSGLYFYNSAELDGRITAPTLQMAMKWLRKVHNIFIEINYDSHEFGNAPYFSLITNMHTNDYFRGHNLPGEKSTYEEACEAAIKYCLENLI